MNTLEHVTGLRQGNYEIPTMLSAQAEQGFTFPVCLPCLAACSDESLNLESLMFPLLIDLPYIFERIVLAP